MKALTEGWSIVLAGTWNAPIFSPKWISEHLTKATDIGIEVPINNPALRPRFVFDNLYLQIGQGRLALSPHKPTGELMERAEGVAKIILNDLKHTPLTAVGINFQFLEDSPKPNLLSIFNFSDSNDLTDLEIKVTQSSINRCFNVGEQELNLTVTLREETKVLFDLNFHSVASDATGALDSLRDKALSHMNEGIALLNKLYGLTLSDGEENHEI